MNTFQELTIKKLTLQAILVVFLATCFYFYEFIMQVAPSVIRQDLMREFAIDATKLGLLSGSFYLSYTPLQLLGGILLDRYSARVILTGVCAIFAFGVLVFANAQNIYTAALARFIMGAAASCAFISVLHIAARWVPPIHFAFFAGITEMMGSLGGWGGTDFLAMLLKNSDWRTITTNFAYVGFVLAVLIALFVRSQPQSHKLKYAALTAALSKNSVITDLKTVLNNKETWAIAFYSFLIWAPVLGFTALWGVAFVGVNNNLDTSHAARMISFVWIGIALASPIIGWLSDVIERRCIIMTTCAIIGAVAMIVIIFIPNIPTIALYILMLALGFASAGQTLPFALLKDNNSPHTNSTANGFNNMILVASGPVFQPLIGVILDLFWQGSMQNGIRIYSLQSYKIAFLILPICYIIAAVVSAFFIKETRCIATWLKK